MTRTRWMIVVGGIGLCIGWSGARGESPPGSKVADGFTIRWSTIRYYKEVVVRNPAVPSAKPAVSESLELSCEIDIRDPNLTLGTCPEGTITQVTDHKGQDIKVGASPNRSRRAYEGPYYRHRITQPPKLPGWQTLIRSVLRVPQNTNFRPQWVNELQPSPVGVLLDAGLLEQAGGEIRGIKGYFYVLMAESLESVAVPFEPNDNWVRLTPDLEIQVAEASCGGTSYQYRIETRPRGRPSMPLSARDPLPSRLVVAQEFIGEDGKPPHPSGGRRFLPAHIGGVGGGSGGSSQIKAIRFVIAVNPAHHKIPFEFRNIPLPDPNQSAGPQDPD